MLVAGSKQIARDAPARTDSVRFASNPMAVREPDDAVCQFELVRYLVFPEGAFQRGVSRLT
jgi:hypothetical protein